MNDIFISYSREDVETARRMAMTLEAKGWSVFWDRTIPAGKTWCQVIGAELEEARCIVVLWSSSSVKSEWVAEEAMAGKMRNVLVPVLIEAGVSPPFGFGTIQAADLSRGDGHAGEGALHRFLDDVAQILPSPESVPEEEEPPREAAQPQIDPARGAQALELARGCVLDCVGPAYILDPNYHFVDWNPTFDELIAKPMGLARGRHLSTFVRRLRNSDEVIHRSQEIFASRSVPLVDVEVLEVETERFGPVRLRKLATQICGDAGGTLGWCVSLDIIETEDPDALWAALLARLEQEINWSRYSGAYDRLLADFPHYNELIRNVVETVRNCDRCIDVGAGSGRVTFGLLDTQPDRVVWSIEANEGMLRQLRCKRAARAAQGRDDAQRLSVLKAHPASLVRVPRNYFDAAVMVNVFFALAEEDKRSCLEEIHGVLKRGGVLVLTTTHTGTNVDKLLHALEKDLRLRPDYRELLPGLDSVRDSHLRMIDRITHDTQEDLEELLDRAGFDISEVVPDYVDAVLRITAYKREKALPSVP